MAAVFSSAAAATTVVHLRVGIVAYDKFEEQYERHRKAFARYSRDQPFSAGVLVNFSLAVGTYQEVLDWYNKQLIDVALLTPGPAAQLLFPFEQSASLPPAAGSPRSAYLATQILNPPPDSPIASQDRRMGREPFTYRSICLVRKGSQFRTLDNLRSGAANGQVHFVFVHPLSLSGYIYPAYRLKQLGIQFAKDPREVAFTYGHGPSMDILKASNTSSEGKEPVVFIWDGADVEPTDNPFWEKVVDANGRGILDHEPLPQEVVFLNHHLANTDPKRFELARQIMQKFLLSGRMVAGTRYEHDPNWYERFRLVSDYVRASDLSLLDVERSAVTLDQLIRDVRTYQKNAAGASARLALVLSGGGAKCSYQVGAVRAIEEALEKSRSKKEPIDIDLVVGTSGGAINALATALGAARHPTAAKQLSEVWENFDQSAFLKPSWQFNLIWGSVVATFCAFLAIGLVRVISPLRRDWWRPASKLIIVIGTVQIIVALSTYLPPDALEILAAHHMLLHGWVIATIVGLWAAPWVLITGLVMLLLGRRSERFRIGRFRSGLYWSRALSGLLILLSFTWAWWVFWRETSLSSSVGIQAALIKSFPSLVQAAKGVDLTSCQKADNPMACLSEGMVNSKVIDRDLIITASMLSSQESSTAAKPPLRAGVLPQDLYFYYAAKKEGARRPTGPSFVSLTEGNRHHLLDVIVASSTIYPLFPPKQVKDVKMPMHSDQDVVLIDGGFAHNNPIDAAVAWGATHIIAIQPSAEEPSNHQTFLQNCFGALGYLFMQAQRVDHISAGKVVIFELRPPCTTCSDASGYDAQHARSGQSGRRYNLDLFDFNSKLVRRNIAYGLEDASSLNPRFRRALGEPKFRELGTALEN